MVKEEHNNLRGGNGIVVTYTRTISFRGRKIKIVRMEMGPSATIGLHQHQENVEIYICLNKDIRFGQNKKKFFNYCPKGGEHCAINMSKDWSIMFAIKF